MATACSWLVDWSPLGCSCIDAVVCVFVCVLCSLMQTWEKVAQKELRGKPLDSITWKTDEASVFVV